MNRIMKRPMFRKGGSAGEGITSGLAPRQGYQNGESVQPFNIRTANMDQIDEEVKRRPLKQPPMAPDNSLRDFKIDFGLDLVSRSPQGNIFQTAGAAAKEPFANFRTSKAAYNKGLQNRSINQYNSESDMFKTLIGAQADILGSDGGSKQFAKQANDTAIQGLMSELFQLDAQQKTDQALADKDYQQQQSILMQRLQGYTGKNPAVSALYGNKEQADLVIGGIQQEIINSEKEIEVMSSTGEKIIVIEGEHAQDNPAYLGEETAKRYIQQYNAMVKNSLGLAEGGRAAYAEGEMVEEQITEDVQEVQPSGDSLSYEELRSRLPGEITDDIVVILSESPQALIDFSELQTQTDVDQFNMKYGVNLALPSGA